MKAAMNTRILLLSLLICFTIFGCERKLNSETKLNCQARLDSLERVIDLQIDSVQFRLRKLNTQLSDKELEIQAVRDSFATAKANRQKKQIRIYRNPKVSNGG
jgi:septal ring factor EnvC (AmiA/AmiB activator)